MPSGVIEQYLNAVRAVRGTGQATGEQSYYPAVFALLDALGAMSPVRRRALAHPAGIDGRFPDVALYEVASNVLVLPVEVKGADASMATLLASTQALSYAQTFGGGHVLLTNLREWVLAVIDDSGCLAEVDRVTLAADERELDAANPVVAPGAMTRLVGMIEAGCQIRGANKAPKMVASLLAYHARQMRDAINAAGDPAELLASINEALSKGLQIELDAEMLTPTVVQTLVYGSFAAWLGVEEPTRFNWMHASYRLSVPVFAEILHGALSPNLLRRCDLTGHLESVARVLAWTDRDEFVSHFDGDAIQYFYEPFLAEFDPALRDALGVWYTPAEIARYQVARTDHHLRTDLNITDGLADDRVYVLDPASGTGTYLLACIDFVFEFHRSNGEPDSIAAQRALEAMLSRFIGFEILPAAFIICHLHLTRHLQQLGAAPSDQRLRVYLTNSLTGWSEGSSPQGMTLFPELEAELHDAAVAKHTDPVIVVLGNPPYHGYSSAETAEERALIEPWAKAATTDWGLRKHRLNDLYVRFWRVAIERIVTLTGRGVVSFITNRKWLGGRSYPSMREAIVTSFDQVWVDDLHGDVHDSSHAGDQSIFTTSIAAGIRVGTAIVTAIRTDPSNPPATVHLDDSYRGSAAHKRSLLDARRGAQMTAGYAAVTTTRASRYRFVADAGNDFPALDEYLPVFHSGVQPVGQAVVDRDKTRLESRMKDYFDSALTLAQVVGLHADFGKARAGYDPTRTRRDLLPVGYDPDKISRYIFRPFDARWIYWEPTTKLLTRPRPELVPFWRNTSGPQVCLIAPQATRRPGAARPYASHAVAGFNAMDPDARVFPLYMPDVVALGEDAGELGLEIDMAETAPTTVAPEWVAAAKTALGVSDDKEAGEAIFYALVAVTHSNEWLTDQPVENDDFATVPLPADPAVLRDAIEAGKELLALLDPDVQVTGVTQGQIRSNLRSLAVPDQVSGTVDITTGRAGERAGLRSGSDVLWDTNGGWHDIPDEVWEYSVGGFQVLPKWLSYRMSGLTAQDRETFRILCRRIQAIIDLAPRCDTIYRSARNLPLTPPTP